MSERQEQMYPFAQPTEPHTGSSVSCSDNRLETGGPAPIHYFTPLDEVRSRRYLDPQIETLLGFSSSEWVDPGFWFRRLHPEDRERVLMEIDYSLDRENRFRSEYRLVARDGHAVWVQDEGMVRRDKGGRVCFMEGMLSTMTGQNQKNVPLR